MKRMCKAPTAASPLRRPIHGRRGSSMIELTLVIWLLLLVAFGSIEYSYAFFVKNTLQAAARETARAGIVPGASRSDAENAGRRVIESAFEGMGDQFTFAWKNGKHPGNTTAGEYIEVTVTAPKWSVFKMRPLGAMPLFSHAAPSGERKFHAAATMRRE